MHTTKPHVIVTCCDAKYGDFLINHWLHSLLDNVDLSNIDVAVLDYGLTSRQRMALQDRDVRCIPCERDGFVCNLRYRDITRLLDHTAYEQVLSVDAGDVVFQADISSLFEQHQEQFRVVAEEWRTPFESVIELSDIRPEFKYTILSFVRDKPILNCGMVLGSARRFRDFWQAYQHFCHAFACYGVDQLVFNYHAYSCNNFRLLDARYNFVLVSAQQPFQIDRGVFRDQAGTIIPIVHNAGNKDWIRRVDHFGYGPHQNRRKVIAPWVVRCGSQMLGIWNHLLHKEHAPLDTPMVESSNATSSPPPRRMAA